MSALGLSEIFARLHAQGLVAQPEAPVLPPYDQESPWYVRLMAGFGAWLGGMFMLGTIMSLFTLALRSAGGMMALGIIMLGIAFALYRAARNSEALQQLGLAASMAGQFALAFGVMDLFHWRSHEIAGFLCLLQIGLVVLMDGVLHRYLSALFAAMAAYWFLAHLHALPLGGAVLAILVAGIWMKEAAWTAANRARLWRPVGHALALALLCWQAPLSLGSMLMWFFNRGSAELAVPGWVAPLAYAICLAGVVGEVARSQAPRAWPRWVAAAFVVSAAAWLAPGLLTALLVLVLGVAAGNRALVGLAIVAAAWYLGAYYHQMQTTLLEKSAVMVGTGLVLIALRLLLAKLWPEAEADHA